METIRAFVKDIPVPVAGVALGVVALGNLLAPLSETVHVACGIVSAALVVLLLAKIAFATDQFAQDMHNPVMASTCATLFMSIMQLASFAAGVAYEPAFALWCAAVVAHFVLMAWFTKTFIAQFDLKHVHATYFIAYVGIIVASLTSPTFGMEHFGQLLFWFGFACYAALLVVVTLRYVHHEVAAPAKPTFCVYAAPMSLSLAGYLAVMPEPNLVFVGVLAVAAQALFLVVLVRVPSFVKGGFYPSYAAMTFPFVITATAASRALDTFAAAGIALPDALSLIVVAETAFAALMVTFVFARYTVFMGKSVRKAAAVRAAA